MEAFLYAISTDYPWTASRSRRLVILSLLLTSLFTSWCMAWIFLAPFNRYPFDGTPDSCDATLAFAGIGSVIGLPLALILVLSRNLFVRTTLSGLASATTVTLLVEWVGVDALTIAIQRAPDAILNSAVAWGLALAPVGAGVALSVHLLRRTSGKLCLTLIVCILSILIGLQSQRFFWKHWDYRSFVGFPGCFPPETEGWLLGMVCAITVCFGTLALDLGARLCAPGATRTLLIRLRSDLR